MPSHTKMPATAAPTKRSTPEPALREVRSPAGDLADVVRRRRNDHQLVDAQLRQCRNVLRPWLRQRDGQPEFGAVATGVTAQLADELYPVGDCRDAVEVEAVPAITPPD